MRYSELLETKTVYNTKNLLKNIPNLNNIKKINRIFQENGFDIRIVGGAVRDLILDKAPKDFDLATDARPDQMIQMLKQAGVKVIETGLQHGTITAVIGGEDYEITTLRIDTETDGRHAKVAFTKDWRQDAERRDLTFNAMSLDLEGNLYDYFGGLEDLKKGTAKFVGSAEQRMQEDYLRILRYFRFQGRTSKPNWDRDTLAAIKANASGLKQISGERIWMEMQKILRGNHAHEILEVMEMTGIDKNIGLDLDHSAVSEFDRVRGNRVDNSAALLVSLLDDEQDVLRLAQKWKLSAEERELMRFLAIYREKPFDEKVAMDMWTNPKIKEVYVRILAYYLGKYNIAKMLKTAKKPEFPVKGQDMLDLGMKPGPDVGKAMQELNRLWKESGYKLSKEELLGKMR